MLARRTEGFNLAFLDIMACGLGAAVLILVLLKNQEGASSPPAPKIDVAALEQDISKLEAEVAELRQGIEARSAKSADSQGKTAALIASLQAVKTEAQKRNAEIKWLKNAITATDRKHKKEINELKNAQIEIAGTSAQEFLIGLEVKGERIVILMDSSSSMLAETLIDITKLKVKKPSDRQKAEKWIRTKKAAKWLLANIPANSSFRMFHFNEKVKEITTGWSKTNTPDALVELPSRIEQIDPAGGTNLEQAMRAVLTLNPSSVYVITDGLPTIGRRSQRLGGCGRHRVTGKCRASLFGNVQSASRSYGGIISVILLPLEGDPAAAGLFSNWTVAHRGTLLSPSKGWP